MGLRELWLLPNLLSLLRLVLTVPMVVLIARVEGPDYALYVVSVVAILTDYLDGLFSRQMGLESDLGKVLDPLADKIAMAGALGALVVWRGYPAHILVLLVIRDVCILIGGYLVTRRTKRVMGAHMAGKINTAVVAASCLAFLVAPGAGATMVLEWMSVGMILVSSFVYFRIAREALG